MKKVSYFTTAFDFPHVALGIGVVCAFFDVRVIRCDGDGIAGRPGADNRRTANIGNRNIGTGATGAVTLASANSASSGVSGTVTVGMVGV